MALRVEIPTEENREMYSYSPSSTTTASSSFTNLTPPPAFLTRQQKLYSSYNNTSSSPLTLENLSKVQLIDPSNTPLARYCQELESQPSSSIYYTESIHSVNTTTTMKRRRDYAIESPRLLPFPYHNDSFFLPTAEHDSPGTMMPDSTTSSHVSLHTFGSRQRHQQHKLSHASLPSLSKVTPSSLRDVMVPQQQQQRQKSSLTFYNNNTQQKSIIPWYKKLWKFISKPLKKQQQQQQQKVETVWYSQFRCNPPPPAGMKPL